MRITKIENQPRIALTLEEAKQIKEALEDYNFLCSSSCGFASPYATDNEQQEELINRLDETILKAEAM